jgi:hypothetical protein
MGGRVSQALGIFQNTRTQWNKCCGQQEERGGGVEEEGLENSKALKGVRTKLLEEIKGKVDTEKRTPNPQSCVPSNKLLCLSGELGADNG